MDKTGTGAWPIMTVLLRCRRDRGGETGFRQCHSRRRITMAGTKQPIFLAERGPRGGLLGPKAGEGRIQPRPFPCGGGIRTAPFTWVLCCFDASPRGRAFLGHRCNFRRLPPGRNERAIAALPYGLGRGRASRIGCCQCRASKPNLGKLRAARAGSSFTDYAVRGVFNRVLIGFLGFML